MKESKNKMRPFLNYPIRYNYSRISTKLITVLV